MNLIDDILFQMLIPGAGGNERLAENATFFDAEMLERVRRNRPDLLERVAAYILTGVDPAQTNSPAATG